MAYIYQIKNDINDKVYVGKTESSLEKRFRQHCYASERGSEENRPLYSAMRKYGIQHFYIELIEETSNPNEREIYWIKEKNSYTNGYNATLGGEGKKKVDDNEIVKLYQFFGTQKEVYELLGLDPDTIRRALRNSGIEINPWPKHEGNRVYVYSMDGGYITEFKSQSDAARWVISNGLTKSESVEKVSYGISRAVDQKKRKTAFGYLWYSKKI